MTSNTAEIADVSASFSEQKLTGAGLLAPQGAYLFGALGMTAALVLGLCAGDGMREFWHSYLLAVCFFTSLALGGLVFVALQHLTRSGWSVILRRLAEIFAMSIQVCGLLFIPIVIAVLCGSGSLYIWNDAEIAKSDPLIQSKVPYLNASFFALRTVFYFVVWTFIARKFWQSSLEQDGNGDKETTLRLERFSAPMLLVYALTVTFASIDWIMSLDPHWFSSIFGIYFFSGSLMAFLAALTLVINLLQQRFQLLPMITADHRHDLGKLLFGFMCFWAYIGFSQYLLIWYANVPEETVWFKVRQSGGWGAVSIALMAGHFALPFLGLMRKSMKRDPQMLAAWALVLLVMHSVDYYWLIFPTLNPSGPTLPLLPISCLMGVGGFYVAAWLSIAGQRSLVPLNDPRLPESLAVHN
ncbi:hypothetical protein [Schlesneria paludicola]|uniref:hypothetical protein n=1 Tax=Schlesneria paludicola TaxID=360056 RepID=UPI00029ADEA4|nr:hypothetical protein [Schlesneria paludicola]